MNLAKSIFKEYDIRGAYSKEIDDRGAYALGVAFAKSLKAKKIVVGRDARPESEKVFWPFVAGLSKVGVKVYSLGVCSTPELLFAVGAKKFSGGAMVTASHSPAGQTGFKLCDAKGMVLGGHSGLEEIRKMAAKVSVSKIQTASGEMEFISILPEYKKFIQSIIDLKHIGGQKIVLDASSGSSARPVEMIFAPLPIYSRRMNFYPGDEYADHGLNPLLKENWSPAATEVKRFKADLGVIFDGDGDRAIFIDEAGEFVEPYYINCLLSKIILSKKKGQKLIVDARLGLGIGEIIKKAGGVAVSHRSGYANIIRTMQAKKVLFACENSGHFMFNFSWVKGGRNYAYGEAVLPVLLILEYLKSKKIKLSKAVSEFKKNYPISGEINIKINNFDKLKTKIKKNFIEEKILEVDGLSIIAKSGEWFVNIRPSHTEPLVRLNVEAKNAIKLGKLKKEIISIINSK